VRENDRGGNVKREKECLEQLMRSNDGPCTVYLLSDRPLTVRLLRNVTRSLNCTPITANHETQSYGYRKEHGPFAGAGFFRDLALAANARDGFAVSLFGPRGRRLALRTSSALVLELMEYRARMEGKRAVRRCF